MKSLIRKISLTGLAVVTGVGSAFALTADKHTDLALLNRVDVKNYLNKEVIFNNISRLSGEDISVRESNGLSNNLEMNFTEIISRTLMDEPFELNFYYGKIDENSSLAEKSINYIDFGPNSPEVSVYYFTMEIKMITSNATKFYGSTYVTIDIRPDLSKLDTVVLTSKDVPTNKNDFINRLKGFLANSYTIKRLKNQYTNFEVTDDFLDLDLSGIADISVDQGYKAITTEALDFLTNAQQARLFKIAAPMEVKYSDGVSLSTSVMDVNNYPPSLPEGDYWAINLKETSKTLDTKLSDLTSEIKKTIFDKIVHQYGESDVTLADMDLLEFEITKSDATLDLETATVNDLSAHATDREKDKKWGIISITKSDSYNIVLDSDDGKVKMHFDVFWK